jgi:hypothetical protein
VRTLLRACAALLVTSIPLAAAATSQDTLAPRWIQELAFLTTEPAVPYTLIPSGRNGVVLRTPEGLSAYSAEGRLRWRYPSIVEPSGDSVVRMDELLDPMASTSDGGMWVVRKSPYPDVGSARVLRISAAGHVQVDRDVSAAPRFNSPNLLMASGDSAAMLFWTSEVDGWGDIGWARVDSNGDLSTGSINIEPRARMMVLATREIQGGDYLVAMTPDSSPWSCSPVPFCGPIRTVVLRISAAGDIVWRHAVALEEGTHFSLAANGETWVAARGNPRHPVQRISAGGRAHPPFTVASPDFDLVGIRQPVFNRMLINEYSHMQLVDLAGNRLAHVAWDPPYPDRTAIFQSRHGYLVNIYTGDNHTQAQLFDNFDLSVRSIARMPGPAHPPYGWVTLVSTQLDDGSIVVVERRSWPDQRVRAHLAIFNVPGTPSEGRLWRDGFDP